MEPTVDLPDHTRPQAFLETRSQESRGLTTTVSKLIDRTGRSRLQESRTQRHTRWAIWNQTSRSQHYRLHWRMALDTTLERSQVISINRWHFAKWVCP